MTDWNHLKIRQEDAITEVTLHTDDGPLVWTAAAALELTTFLNQAAMDADHKVYILTGTGEDWCRKLDPSAFQAMGWRKVWSMEQNLLNSIMELNAIVISAINGPAFIHSDLPVLADIVLACPEAVFSDPYHFKRNVVPGDGVHLVWGQILGASRATYFCLTGEKLDAAEALRLGAVHEIHPRADLLARAWELARTLGERPPSVLAFTKAALRLRDRRHFRQDLGHSLSLQGLGMHALGYVGPE